MLVLSRRMGEEIVLPSQGVTICVVAVKGGQVRLGIAAPSEVSVHRGEVWQRICESRESDRRRREEGGKPLRVLIADADHTLASFYRETLAAKGFDVHAVTSGLECVAHLRQWPPHVLVMDPSLPWGGGDGVLALMREEDDVPAVPVLVHAWPKDGAVSANLASAVGARAVKPLPPERMACLVRQLLDGGTIRQPAAPAADNGKAWQHEVMRKIAARTHGHVLDLEVEVVDGCLIVHGRSRSYYGKQLACAAAMNVMKTLAPECAKHVEVDIEVLDSRQPKTCRSSRRRVEE